MRWRRERPLLLCPVCGRCSWNLYGVALARHRTHFLKSRMQAIQGPWGTCTGCGNHFSLSLFTPRLLDRAGGYPVENAALMEAKRRHADR